MSELQPGRVLDIDGVKWLVLRTAGRRAEIKKMDPGEVVQVKPNRKERRRIWAELRKRAKKGRVEVDEKS